MNDSLLIAGIGIALSAAVMAPWLALQRRRERETAANQARARALGLDEPATLHPVIEPGGCIGTGNCADVCPEQEVIGFRDGQAVVVAPARCIGHGLCERVCPVDAIRLVFGTATRGVDLPRVRENFETNVPGLFVVGELGGMGLIRNAFDQGRQCIDGIRRSGRKGSGDILDIVVVGCGPAGLAATLHSLEHGLRIVTLEKEADIGGTVRHYPRKKLVMTSPVKVPGYGTLSTREIRKEALIDVWSDVVSRTGMRANTGEEVQRVERAADGTFTVATTGGTYRAANVVLAIGRRGVPRRLGVPGEDSPDVLYSLLEPDAWAGDRVLVVGGGDSAVEAALALGEQPGTTVRLAYRGDRFNRIKPGNRQRIDQAASAGLVDIRWNTQVREIRPGEVVLESDGGGTQVLGNDRVFVFIGGELPTRFLRDCGVEIETKFGTP